MERTTLAQQDWPISLKNHLISSSQLHCWGDISLLRQPMISVVGARDIQAWAMEWMEYELMPSLKKMGVGVVSGGARGVDQRAHQIALRAGLGTIVVLPSGLNQLYPKSLCGWRENPQVLFVSEYEDDTPMYKGHFYQRNRLVVGLTQLTLVIQAGEKSGTMISARMAIESGRTLAALPGNPLERWTLGNNQLLYDGAAMVRNGKDLEALVMGTGVLL